MAALKLGMDFHRLVWEAGRLGAIDVIYRHEEVQAWFAGQVVYGDRWATYPPASMVMLWPLVSWENPVVLRWFWALMFIGCMVWMMERSAWTFSICH